MKPGSSARLLRRLLTNDLTLLVILALAMLVLQLLFIRRYGIFRDELYYLACSEHLAWGYVDQPPLSIALLALDRRVLGDSLFAIRLPAALAGAMTVFLTGYLTREVGGGRFAQSLAALTMLVAPVYLAISHFFSMNAFDVLLWTAAAYVFVRIVKEDSLKRWVALGVMLGLGLLNKISVLWLILGLFTALLLTPHRQALTRKGPWLAGALAGVIFLPHIVWQITHGWPTLEFIHNATTYKMAPVSVPAFFVTQWLAMNPVTAPIWLTGLFSCLFSRGGRRWRVLGYAFLTVLIILLVSGKSRPNYLSPAYPLLLAPGALAIEQYYRRKNGKWRRGAALAALILSGVVVLPFAVPVLPVADFLKYSKAIGTAPPQEEKGEKSVLPQLYADMFGWPEMVAAVARVYNRLPPADRSRCAIYASNYGEAGAIDFYGKRYGLPKAISGHNNYWLWGPRGWTGEVAILVNGCPAGLARLFANLRRADVVPGSRYSMPFERNVPIWIGRNLKIPVEQAWSKAKTYL
jgi:hypothetical protein